MNKDDTPYTFYYPKQNCVIELTPKSYRLLFNAALAIQEKIIDTKEAAHVVWADERGDDYYQYFVFPYNALLREILEALIYVRSDSGGVVHYLSETEYQKAIGELPEDQKENSNQGT